MTGIIGIIPILFVKLTENPGLCLMHIVFMKEPHISGMRNCPFMLRKNIRDWGWEGAVPCINGTAEAPECENAYALVTSLTKK